MKLILGIDDAGRGPVIGPMVLAGCLIDEKTEKALRKLGVKDSKQLTQKRREFLEKEIKERAETFEIVSLFPNEIERFNEKGIKLNEIEALMAAEIINKINKGYKKIRVVLDCPSPNKTKWRDFLIIKIKDLYNLEIVCEHKADKNHIAVAAASILAKCTREKEMSLLKAKYGDEIGSGYCSDSRTSNFILKNLKKYDHDGIFRKTWKTWKKARANSEQKKLDF